MTVDPIYLYHLLDHALSLLPPPNPLSLPFSLTPLLFVILSFLIVVYSVTDAL